jgi:predicted GTPase
LQKIQRIKFKTCESVIISFGGAASDESVPSIWSVVQQTTRHFLSSSSQVFSTVYAQKPAASLLTSFSVLFARYKGDIDYFVESAAAIGQLREDSRVLIAEACTHAPVGEDIGRVKIPAMLRKRIGPALRVDVVAGTDFPADLTPYDLVIHCGACMFNRRHVLSRVAQARAQHVPMTNYGVAIAYLQGILDKIEY